MTLHDTQAQEVDPTVDQLHRLRDSVPTSSINTESTHQTSLRRILVSGDAVAIFLALAAPSLLPGSWLARVMSGLTWARGIGALAVLASCVFICLGVLASERLYLSRVASMRTVEISRIGRAAVVMGVVMLIVDRMIGEAHLVRVPILKLILVFVLLNAWRAIFRSWLGTARKNGRFVRPVLLVGANEEAHNLYRLIQSHPELGYRIRGVVGSSVAVSQHGYEAPWLGEVSCLTSVLEDTGIKGALVVGGALNRTQLNAVVRKLLDERVHVHLSTGISGIDTRRIRNQSLAYEPMMYVERTDLEGWQLAIKRTLDITIATTTLLITLPLLTVAALMTKLHDRGPIFFRQTRIGRDGHPFEILKLRTMVTDAENQLAVLRKQNVRSGPLFKLAFDPRTTGIGRILRATSIDELPQLINVLRGDMSLVGPRPALPEEVAAFPEALKQRHNVLPGITGLWQVEGRDNPDFGLYERLDLFYVENWSVALDLSILLGTAKVVAQRGGKSMGRFIRRRSNADEPVIVLD